MMMNLNSLNKNAYFFPNGPVGCLLIHGFTGTPDELHELGLFLTQQELTVSIPLLPGHGTTPEELAGVKWSTWVDWIRDEYSSLQEKCQEVFIGGQSMGGALALHLGSHSRPAGIITFAAPVKFHHPLLTFYPLVKYFYHHYPKKYGNDIRDPEMKQKLQSYQVYPLLAVLEFQKLLKHTYDDLPEINAPILAFHSRQDHTIDLKNIDIILNRIGSKIKEKIILEESYHLITADVERDFVKNSTLAFIRQNSRFLK
ncbi:alpha/beta fold hydrolase [candidate division KSB1 bacterium]|nr:alpha/beta fold hydrolase [candidate division KSB1 bacterium]